MKLIIQNIRWSCPECGSSQYTLEDIEIDLEELEQLLECGDCSFQGIIKIRIGLE